MIEFIVKVDSGYDTRYYSTVAGLVNALESLRFVNFEIKEVGVFVRSNQLLDERRLLKLLERNSEVSRRLHGDELKAWKKDMQKEIETILGDV